MTKPEAEKLLAATDHLLNAAELLLEAGLGRSDQMLQTLRAIHGINEMVSDFTLTYAAAANGG